MAAGPGTGREEVSARSGTLPAVVMIGIVDETTSGREQGAWHLESVSGGAWCGA